MHSPLRAGVAEGREGSFDGGEAGSQAEHRGIPVIAAGLGLAWRRLQTTGSTSASVGSRLPSTLALSSPGAR